MLVTLTWSEMMIAHVVAGQRIVLNAKRNVQPKFGAPTGAEGDALHISSCRAEMAVAKAFNLYWSGSMGDYTAVDVGGKIEARSIVRQSHRLIMHKEDKDDLPFVVANVADAPRIKLCGWIMGRDGKQEQWWADPQNSNRWAYFIPQSALNRMDDLKV